MKIPKRKEPKIKDLDHISTNWYEEKRKLIRVSVYNKKEEVPKEPKGDGPLTNEQFNKLMGRFDGLENKVDGLETKVDANTAAIKSVKEDVKKLDDRIQNLVDKNDLKE